jgi:hypothetical protein
MKKFFKIKINYILANFTLAKFLAAVITALLVASLKYSISGSLHIEYSDFLNNVGIALLGWILNTGMIDLLTEHLGIKGINFNLKQFIYDYDTMKAGLGSSIEDPKSKLYHAMDSDEESNSMKGLDKGKGIDRESHPFYDRDALSGGAVTDAETKPLDKGKEVVQPTEPMEPHMFTWSRVFPGVDPASVFFPKKINPGAGFNVPGGEVPIRDEICRHIDYNTHILSQFKKMDLGTAIEQRNNNLLFVRVIEGKLDFAKNTLEKVPTIPTTEHEFRLKNQILRDIDSLNRDKVRAEARATLLTSRIEFIEGQINKT